MKTKQKTMDELLEEVLSEVKQNCLERREMKVNVMEDEFFKLTTEERLDLLPF